MTALDRLREWTDDDLHLGQSVRFHEPTYKNPAEIRRDVRELIAVVEAAIELNNGYGFDYEHPTLARLEEALSKFEIGV